MRCNNETDFFASKKSLNFSGYAYLFPFGSLCVNLKIRNTKESTFSKLIELLCSYRRSKQPFSKWALTIANDINQQLFTKPQAVFDFQPHTMLFLEETNMSPVIGDPEHRKAIAGLIECKDGFVNLDKNYVNTLLECKLPNRINKEIVIFYPSTTFIYPSPNLTKKTKHCMRTNYFDFLNFLFGVKHLIRGCSAKKIPKANLRLKDVKNAIEIGFSNKDYALQYFKNLYPKIAQKIELDKNLKTFVEAT